MAKRRKLIILCAVVLVGGIGVLLLFSKGKRPLASLSYLGASPSPKSDIGRFSISNSSDSPITFNVIGVEYYSNQVWELETINGPDTILPPHQNGLIEFAPPAGTKRWRGWLNVGQEQKGIARVWSQVAWVWGQARVGFPNGMRWPTGGKITDGDVLITREVGE